MSIIYQFTFLTALGLFAILITVFVFAVSLLGRATESSSQEQARTTKEQKESIEKEIAGLSKRISRLRVKGRLEQEITNLEDVLKRLKRQEKRFEKDLKRIENNPKLLTVKGGVVLPGVLLLGAMAVSGIALSIALQQGGLWLVHFSLWILSVLAIGYSLYRIYQSLKVIEGVAITTEEAAMQRMAIAFKVAQKELEEEKRPELKLTFPNVDFPLQLHTSEEQEIKLKLTLRKGDTAEDITVFIAVPPGFDFPGLDSHLLPSDHSHPNYLCLNWKIDSLIGRVSTQRTITIKAPVDAGTFKLVYWIICRRFETDAVECAIIVLEPDFGPDDILF